MVSKAEQKRRSAAVGNLHGAAVTCGMYGRRDLAAQLTRLADQVAAGELEVDKTYDPFE